MDNNLELFFLPADSGQLFAIYRPPSEETASLGDIVFVHPFGEELNKSRRMVALQSREFAKKGFGVLQIDLYGCGDSSGNFGEARWETWKENLQTAIDWLHQRGSEHLTLWGLRAGCLLMLDFVNESDEIFKNLLLWQPVLCGERFMTNLLRLRVVSQIGEKKKETTKALRQKLANGETIEVAGYELTPDLFFAIDGLHLGKMAPAKSFCAHWMEVAPKDGRDLSPASARVIGKWKTLGMNVYPQSVVGEPFWQTAEIAVVQELINATTRIFERMAS